MKFSVVSVECEVRGKWQFCIEFAFSKANCNNEWSEKYGENFQCLKIHIEFSAGLPDTGNFIMPNRCYKKNVTKSYNFDAKWLRFGIFCHKNRPN